MCSQYQRQSFFFLYIGERNCETSIFLALIEGERYIWYSRNTM